MTARRTVFKTVLAASGAAAAGAGLVGAAPAFLRRGPYSTPVELRWLGVSGWEIVIDGDRSILFDPYMSRMACTDSSGAMDLQLPLRFDREAVDRVAGRHLAGPPELILVSHGHFDHLADVPQLLARPEWKRARLRTLCDETVRNLLTAMGTPRRRLEDVIQVKGGEYLQFDGYTVEVFRSLHSQRPDHGCPAPGHRTSPPRRPTVLSDLVEGDTLAYQVSVDKGPSILLMGASNFIERELQGIRPDAVAVPMTPYTAVHRYIERLISVTGNPPLLIPSHHDDMTTPLSSEPRLLAASARPTAAGVLSKAAPDARVLTPRHLKALPLTEELS
ncbi:MBL fold metallo-hydrolase [Streptomyces sp. NPDC002851]